MNKAEFLLNYKQMIPMHVWKEFESDLDEVIKESKGNHIGVWQPIEDKTGRPPGNNRDLLKLKAKHKLENVRERWKKMPRTGEQMYIFIESELNSAFTEIAEKQRVRDLAIHSINRTKPFHEIKEEIHKSSLVTEKK